MDGFFGEVRAFSWDWAPEGWMYCNGAVLPSAQYQVLYSVIGTQFGGNAPSTFALPDLRGRSPMGTGNGPGLTLRPNAQHGGSETVTLTYAQMPNHNHSFNGGGPAVSTKETAAPTNGTSYDSRLWNTQPNPDVPLNAYILPSVSPANTTFAQQMIGVTGQGQQHENRQPLLVVNFCICNDGVYPVHD